MEAWPREDVPVKIADFDICVPRMTPIDAAIIGRAKRLKLIVQFGVGLEGVALSPSLLHKTDLIKYVVKRTLRADATIVTRQERCKETMMVSYWPCILM